MKTTIEKHVQFDSRRCFFPGFDCTLIQCLGTTNNSCGGVTTAFIFHCLKFGNLWGDPFVNFKLPSLMFW